MNKVITINLGGTAFQLEEAGFDVLRAYLDGAATRLQANPDRDEIVSDIEQAIGDKFRGLLNAHKNVILTKEVQDVLTQMGPIEDDSAATAGAPAGGESSESTGGGSGGGAAFSPKRLYRIREGAMLAGVCNGLGAYFNVDPTLVRLAFVLLTLAWGAGVLVYLVMAIVVPAAESPEQKAAAHGTPYTAQEFIRRARQGYYDAMKSFPDRQARREWKRRFKQEMRDWRTSFHREMTSQAQEWRHHWGNDWAANPGAGVALPLVSLAHGALVILWVCALISLLATGAVFGVALPASIPVWGGVLILLVAYGIVIGPLKVARRAFYYRGYTAGPAWSFFFVFDALVWIGVVAALLWLAFHHVPQAHDAIRNIPGVIHDAANSIRDWWHNR